MNVAASPWLELPTRQATKRLARSIAQALQPGDAVILSGALGAGKTFLVRALCRALGLDEGVRVVSPTFTLIRELPTVPPVAHADLYRLASPADAHELGLSELRESGRVLLVEWGEAHAAAIGPDHLLLALELGPRRARLIACGERSEALRAAVLRALAAPLKSSPGRAYGKVE
jgi:tRNA threonylcarbamoyl adenosine modification protein YjeE